MFGIRVLTLILVFLCAAATARADEPLRTWADRTGKFQTRASLVEVKDGVVHLKREDGAEIRVPLARLSDNDRKYVEGVDAAKAEALDAVIPVWTRTDGVPGTTAVIFAASDGRAIAVTQHPSYGRLNQNTTLFARAPAEGARTAEMLATHAQSHTVALGLPADSFPAAVTTSNTIHEGHSVLLRGFEFDMSVNPPAFAGITRKGRINKVFRDAAGVVSRFQVQCEERVPIVMAVFNDAGESLGLAQPGSSSSDMPVTPWHQLEIVFEPRVTRIALKATASSTEEVDYRFELAVADPFYKAQESQLRIAPRVDNRSSDSAVGPDGALLEGTTVPIQREAETGELYAVLSGPPPTGQSGNYRVQLTYKSEGATHFGPPAAVSIAQTLLSDERRGTAMPRAIAHKDGGYLFTSSNTKVQADQLKGLPQLSRDNYPQPEVNAKLMAGPGYRLDDVPASAIQVPPGTLVDDVVFSPDGKWFYCVSKAGLVRKIALDDFQQQRTLALGLPATGLALSKDGLIVAISEPLQIVLIDSETLAIKGHTPLPAATNLLTSRPPGIPFRRSPANNLPVEVAGSAASSLVVALGQGTMWVIDASIPQTRHRVEGVEDRWAEVGPEGRYVYTALFTIKRYRVDGTDLILEETSPRIGATNPQSLALSLDGRRVALPCGGGNRHQAFPPVNYGTYVLDAHHLDKLVTTIESGAYPRTVAFDPKTGNIYTQNSDSLLLVFNRDGKQINSTAQRSHHETRFFASPLGERLFVLSSASLLWLDLREGAEPFALDDLPAAVTKGAELRPLEDALDVQEVGKPLDAKKLNLPDIDVWQLPDGDETKATWSTWSHDGKYFYLLSSTRTLQQVDAESLEVKRQVELESECTGLVTSGVGIVAALKDRQALWVLDFETLQLLQKISVAQPTKLAAARDVPLAVVASRHGFESLISVIDLARGKILVQFHPRTLGERLHQLTPGKSIPPIVDMQNFAVSSDGRFLYSQGSFSMVRMRIGPNGTLFPDKSVEVHADNPGRMSLSDDGKLVATPGGGGNRLGQGKARRTASYTTYVFYTENLQQEPIAIGSGAYPRAIGLAPQAKRIYAQNHDSELMVYSLEGDKLAEYDLAEGSPIVRDIQPDPSGNKVLIVATGSIWLASLNGDDD